MIITAEQNCTGCGLCVEICPQHCIRMQADAEGFEHPLIDTSVCTECGLCQKKCPVNALAGHSNSTLPEHLQVMGGYAKDDAIRTDSTSGGFFSLLAQHFFDHKGMVAGAIYRQDHSVGHILTADPKLLEKLRSSKYLQSSSDGIFQKIKLALAENRDVLFCGTPCQCAALQQFLGRKYDNLTVCDFICIGVNSPLVFRHYISELEKKHNAAAKIIKFKDKTHGWHNFSLRLEFENGQTYCGPREEDPFFRGFLKQRLFLRPSCFNCRFKGFPRYSDFTLADFWGIESIDPTLDQDRGTSLLMLHTPQAKDLFAQLKPQMVSKEFPASVLTNNHSLHTSICPGHQDRKEFFQYLQTHSFHAAARKFFPLPLSKRIRLRLKKNPLILDIWSRYQYFKIGMHAYCRAADCRADFRKFINMNFWSKGRVIRKPGAWFVALKHAIVDLHPTARIFLDGYFLFGRQIVRGSRFCTRLQMKENARMHIGAYTRINSDSCIIVWHNAVLDFGTNVFMHEHTHITCGESIHIGSNTIIARDVVIRDYDAHHLSTPGYRISKPIHIGEHVWIGNRVMILKGVTIGDNAVIAAGSVVTKDVPPNCVAAGCPAKVIRENVSWQ